MLLQCQKATTPYLHAHACRLDSQVQILCGKPERGLVGDTSEEVASAKVGMRGDACGRPPSAVQQQTHHHNGDAQAHRSHPSLHDRTSLQRTLRVRCHGYKIQKMT
jgi:hypothetical protein